VIVSGIATAVNPRQPVNAPSERLVTLAGIESLVETPVRQKARNVVASQALDPSESPAYHNS